MTVKEYEYCYRKHFKSVVGYLMLYCYDKELAEDLAQDTFISLWEKVDSIRFDTVRQWLHAVSYNKMIDYKRRGVHKARYLNTLGEETYCQSFDQYDVGVVIKETMALPGIKGLLIATKALGSTYKEICETYDMTMPQVKALIHKGRQKLNNKLKYYE